LHSYQAGENFGINATGIYEVKTKDNQTFSTTIYPFLQTDYLLGELMGSATEITEYPEFTPRSQIDYLGEVILQPSKIKV